MCDLQFQRIGLIAIAHSGQYDNFFLKRLPVSRCWVLAKATMTESSSRNEVDYEEILVGTLSTVWYP